MFRISTSGQETVLDSFGANSGDGAYPYGDLYYDGKQYLYGTLAEGGAHSGGAVFRVSVIRKDRNPVQLRVRHRRLQPVQRADAKRSRLVLWRDIYRRFRQ